MNIPRLLLLIFTVVQTAAFAAEHRRPNILIAISDDQSFPHASAYGSKMVRTPVFDAIAKGGALFINAFCASPGCSPSRAALLTGRYPWQIEQAGTHDSSFPARYATFPEVLGRNGYWVGFTGKGWGPGNYKADGRKDNPAGRAFPAPKTDEGDDYAAGFAKFLDERPEGEPFCFWFGSHDPHRPYRAGSGAKSGMDAASVSIPASLPDEPEIRKDFLDYAFAIERFDRDLGRIVALLKEHGELENTLIFVTSDNGMPFPRFKANCYEYGIHMPLAVQWPGRIPGGQRIQALVSLVDLAPTIYQATGVSAPAGQSLSGESLLDELEAGSMKERGAVFAGRERHSSSRYNTLGYPQRAIRTAEYLYIRNFAPERWPAGDPQAYVSPVYDEAGELRGEPKLQSGVYADIDDGPTLRVLVEHADEPKVQEFLDLATAMRPAEELYDIRVDPDCLKNLAEDGAHQDVRKELEARLMKRLVETGDPRATGNGDVWETYPRYSKLRWFPEPQWAIDHPEKVPDSSWLETRRPKSQKAPGSSANSENEGQ